VLEGYIVEGDLNARNNLAESRNGGKDKNDERKGLHVGKKKTRNALFRGYG
jgi:hypothetical protein